MKHTAQKSLFGMRSFTLGIFWALAACAVSAQGRVVEVIALSGARIEGELLLVTPNELLLSTEPNLDDDDLMENPSLFTRIPVDSIVRAVLKGESKVISGMAVGAGIGLGVGLIVGVAIGSQAAEESDPRQSIGYAAGGTMAILAFPVIGLTIGTIVGVASSTADREYPHVDSMALTELVSESRYGTDEPDFMREAKIGIPVKND